MILRVKSRILTAENTGKRQALPGNHGVLIVFSVVFFFAVMAA
jgi:hypothetical protein